MVNFSTLALKTEHPPAVGVLGVLQEHNSDFISTEKLRSCPASLGDIEWSRIRQSRLFFFAEVLKCEWQHM